MKKQVWKVFLAICCSTILTTIAIAGSLKRTSLRVKADLPLYGISFNSSKNILCESASSSDGAHAALTNDDNSASFAYEKAYHQDGTWQSLQEGGVIYPNGKKPLQLLSRIVKAANCKDGVFLDFFLHCVIFWI